MSPARYLRIDILALGFAAVALWSSPATAEIAIGAARLVVADVSAETALASRRLATADEVRYQELIATERSSAAVIQFVDGTELAIGEQARVRRDEFVLGNVDVRTTDRVSELAIRDPVTEQDSH
jgi:hypothetical protein